MTEPNYYPPHKKSVIMEASPQLTPAAKKAPESAFNKEVSPQSVVTNKVTLSVDYVYNQSVVTIF